MKRAKTPTNHTKRNAYLREQANAVDKALGLSFEEFVILFTKRANAIAAEKNMRWYTNKKDTHRSIRNWLNGSSDVYWWGLDVIELAVLQFKAEQREKRVSHTLTPEEAGKAHYHRPGEITPMGSRVESAEARTISSGTRGELDALREIVYQYVPLKDEARQRVLRYLESL